MALTDKEKTEYTNDPENSGKRRKSKEFRQDQLINSTIDTLAKKGFAATTLADVADGAGLSRGIVNFHFESKEKLLFSTLEFISQSYAENWKKELKKVAKQSAAKQLHILVKADLNNKVCTPRLISAWFGFYSEAQTRPSFRELCWARDDDYLSELRDLCERLKHEGRYSFDPGKTADAIYAMQEGLWLRLMMASKRLNRASALEIALTTLGTLFPKHFDLTGTPTK